jgi:hypothetical protein
METPAAEKPKGMRACSDSADAWPSAPNREATNTADFKRFVFIRKISFRCPKGGFSGKTKRTRQACGKESSSGMILREGKPGRGLLHVRATQVLLLTVSVYPMPGFVVKRKAILAL